MPTSPFATSRLRLLAVLATLGLLHIGDTPAGPRTDPWKPSELNEQHMRTLTKHQCMLKSIATLELGCRTRECLMSVGGIIGDCIAWARGDQAQFCASYPTEYIASYCASNELDARACTVIHGIYTTACTKKQ